MNATRNTRAINKISNGIKIVIKNFQKRLPINFRKIKRTTMATCELEGIIKSGEITICLVDDKTIQGLNLRYLGKREPTDVLTFDLTDPYNPDYIFADIVISTDRVIDNTRLFRTNPLFELSTYVVHGILHLFGYNDKRVNGRRRMESKVNQVLSILNIKAGE